MSGAGRPSSARKRAPFLAIIDKDGFNEVPEAEVEKKLKKHKS